MVSFAVLDSNLSSEEGCEDDPDDLLTTPSAEGPEALEDIMISDDLTEEQRHEVSALLNEFPYVFTDRPGLTNLIEHEIRTIIDNPIRISVTICHGKKIVNEEIDKMLKMNIFFTYSNGP